MSDPQDAASAKRVKSRSNDGIAVPAQQRTLNATELAGLLLKRSAAWPSNTSGTVYPDEQRIESMAQVFNMMNAVFGQIYLFRLTPVRSPAFVRPKIAVTGISGFDADSIFSRGDDLLH